MLSLRRIKEKEKLVSVQTIARPENEKMIYCLHTRESGFFLQLLRFIVEKITRQGEKKHKEIKVSAQEN